MWVPALSPTFNRESALAGLSSFGPDEYTQSMFEESLVINTLGAAMIALAILLPLILTYPRFKYRPQRIVTVTHDRYGWESHK